VLEALDHQDYPFSILVERLRPARDPARSPLFQVMFSFQKMKPLNDEGLSLFALGEAGAQMNLAGLELESMALEHRASQFELTLMMAESDRGLTATFEYDADLFDDATIIRMTRHFQTLLEAIAASPDERISRLPLLPPAEVGLLIEKCNDSQTRFSDRHTIHSLFERQVERAPEAVALVFEHQRLSYEQLNKRANQLAYQLIKLGVGPDVLVGICLERSFEMIIGLFAVLKAGGAYVPLPK
jgi:non-ribosomal peptide synthetase component F